MLERLTAWLAGDGSDNLVASHIGFNAPFPAAVCFALLAATGVGTAFFYWRRLGHLETPYRSALVALRTAAIVLVLFLLLDPSIVAQRIKPGEQFVVLLFDDSKSMRIVGEDGVSRADRLLTTYEASIEEFEDVLKQKHQLARYKVGSSIEPIQSVEALSFEARESDLTGAVRSSLMDMEGTNVSAVILFSDGVQQSSNEPVAISEIKAIAPVFTVGVDQESDWRDIEISDISVKRTDFDKSPVIVNAGVSSTGLAGRQAMVEAMLGKRVVKSRLIEIDEDADEHEVRLEFIPDRDGWLEYDVRVRLLAGPSLLDSGAPIDGTSVEPDERILENNVRRFVVDNREKEYRILYVAGRPNWEHKFIGRALGDDDNLRVTSLIAISDAAPKFEFRGKGSTMANPLFEGFDEDRDQPRYDESVYLRIGASEDELVSGYPVAAEELFEYSLVIWGDLEKDFFNTTQLELTRDYVEKRGGNLLILGGPKTLTEGKFAESVIASMLPVVLYRDETDARAKRIEELYSVVPTMEGFLAGSWSFDTNSDVNVNLFMEMPELFGIDPYPIVRPGATVMAEAAHADETLDGRPVYAIQRYGEGQCALLSTSDTWQWQMNLDEDDDRHERLWRQIVRHLVHQTPEAGYLREKEDSYTQGEPAKFQFVVRDKEFERREGLHTSVMLTTPSGQETPLSIDESIQEAGLYTSEFSPEEPGLYELTLSALNDKDEVVCSFGEAFLVEPDEREFQNAQYSGELLERIADATEGGHYGLDQLAALADAVPLPIREDADQIWLHLWHLPGFYIALVSMMTLEWYLRRRKGQA